MVLSHHGYRDRVHSSLQFALQWIMALLDIRRYLRPERSAFLLILLHITGPLYRISRDMGCDDQASDAVAVRGHISNGSCNDREYGGFRLCPSVGIKSDKPGMKLQQRAATRFI